MTEHIATHATPKTLVEGQRLDQPTFHALYQAMPAGTRAELIDGVVHMPGPVGLEHGEAHVPVIVWLSYYAEKTPGVRAMDNATTILGWKSEPQPDGLLRILPEFGGRTSNEGGFVHGAPELVAEIAKATRYADFGPKLDDYQRAGVTEYVVRAFDPHEICWFSLDQRRAGATNDRRRGIIPFRRVSGPVARSGRAVERRHATAPRHRRRRLRHRRSRRVRRAAGWRSSAELATDATARRIDRHRTRRPECVSDASPGGSRRGYDVVKELRCLVDPTGH